MIERGDRLDDVTQAGVDELLVVPDFLRDPGNLVTELRDEIRRLREQLCSRGPCAHCGGDNPKGGLYCSDRCRARHARIHAPGGKVRSSRSLANGGWSIVVHLPPGEADRGAKFRVKDPVYLVEGDE